MLFRSLRFACRTVSILIILMIALPLQLASLFLFLPSYKYIPMYCCRFILFAGGVRVRRHGPLPKPGTLILANHVSWLDIIIISSLVPVNFVAKADISGWPFVGFLAKIARTIFIDRDRRTDTARQRDIIQQRLQKDCVVLFPEGSTGDGTIVQPFKSALLSAAETPEGVPPTPIQPMSLVFSELYGIPMNRRMRVEYAWLGQADLLPHIVNVLMSEPITVDIVLYPPTDLHIAGGRKALSAKAHRLVQDGLAAFTVGHDTPSFSWKDGKHPAMLGHLQDLQEAE